MSIPFISPFVCIRDGRKEVDVHQDFGWMREQERKIGTKIKIEVVRSKRINANVHPSPTMY